MTRALAYIKKKYYLCSRNVCKHKKYIYLKQKTVHYG